MQSFAATPIFVAWKTLFFILMSLSLFYGLEVSSELWNCILAWIFGWRQRVWFVCLMVTRALPGCFPG